jgi:hypothetical protein
MNKLIEMQKNVKAITRKYEEDLIKLNVEVFRSIDGQENYAISSFGKVKNTKTGKILKTRNDKYGYLRVDLRENAIRKTHLLHRLVCCAFINNPNKKQFVDHIDNNPQNNHISNLRFATNKENQQNSKLSIKNTSGVKGVYFDKRRKKWRAQIKIDGIRIHIGYFDNLEDAKIARINRANQAFGVYTNACEKL